MNDNLLIEESPDYTTNIDGDLFYTDLDDLEFEPVKVEDNIDYEDNFGYNN